MPRRAGKLSILRRSPRKTGLKNVGKRDKKQKSFALGAQSMRRAEAAGVFPRANTIISARIHAYTHAHARAREIKRYFQRARTKPPSASEKHKLSASRVGRKSSLVIRRPSAEQDCRWAQAFSSVPPQGGKTQRFSRILSADKVFRAAAGKHDCFTFCLRSPQFLCDGAAR